MKRKYFIEILKWFLPLLFICFINSRIFFTHSHFENNSVIVHSHPFDKGENTPHKHTAKELIAIEFHTHGISTDAIIPHFLIKSPVHFFVKHNFLHKSNVLYQQENRSVLLRAPPLHSKI